MLGEEFGELTKDVLQMTYEPGIRQKEKTMFAWLKRLFDRSTDPVYSCDLYRDKSAGSCAHVNGPLCDFPEC